MELNRGMCSLHYCSLFTYLDQVILSLKDLGVGCHLDGMFVGAFSYADDGTLLASTNMALKAMLNTCREFAASHNLYLTHPKQNVHVCILMVPDRKHTAMLNSWVRQLIL